MHLAKRIKKLEEKRFQMFDEWIKGLSDEELIKIRDRYPKNDGFSEWLTTLTDEELEIVRYNKLGAPALKKRFNEFQKQFLKGSVKNES